MAHTRKAKTKKPPKAKSYRHKESTSPSRPDVGTQAQFKKKKPPKSYRYDSSLAPELNWDGQNPGRELGEWLLARLEEVAGQPDHRFDKPKVFKDSVGTKVATVVTLQDCIQQLRALGSPFLNWAGKAEHLSFEVPTLPLFIHERLSTKAIIETLKSHRKDEGAEQTEIFDLYGDPQRPIADQVLKAYEYQDEWVNRLILGDSLVVMNSLLEYENLGGQVQMIYIDPPYGVKFGSNFQPFVRKRDVKHNDDKDFTREPEMVQAYRDTWEMGLHSYLSYMRDRVKLARDLLTQTGSVFVQIGWENLHHVFEVMEGCFGSENFCGVISFYKTAGQTSKMLPSTADYLIWFAKEKSRAKFNPIYLPKDKEKEVFGVYSWIELPDGSRRRLTKKEKHSVHSLPVGSKIFRLSSMTSQSGSDSTKFAVEFEGETFGPGRGYWKSNRQGIERLIEENRVMKSGTSLAYVRYLSDFPVTAISNMWTDTGTGSFTDPKVYSVQTGTKVIQRCMLMTTEPGDLVLDPTCGSGTTAYVAEHWGRRWITVDVSRVPVSIARQRLLSATYPYFELKNEQLGPSSGFKYRREQNSKGEEVGGVVPHVTLKSVATREPVSEEIVIDRPRSDKNVVRVSGPFCVEATIPTPRDLESKDKATENDGISDGQSSYQDRMMEVIRKAPVIQVGDGRKVTFKNIRRPAKTLSLSAEAGVEATSPGQKPTLPEAVDEADDKRKGKLELTLKPVAIVFGPENGAVSERLVYEAAKEANAKSYSHLYVIGFAVQPNARKLVDECERMFAMPATYIQATPDIMMGDLLKNMRSSQIFSVCGLPDVEIKKIKDKYQVTLKGLDVFDPSTMDTVSLKGEDVPAWFLDTNYNGLCFHVSQAFFPRTAAWESLKKALKGMYTDSVWAHLRGNKSVPFSNGEHNQIAVKVIDDRGNELLVVKDLPEVNS